MKYILEIFKNNEKINTLESCDQCVVEKEFTKALYTYYKSKSGFHKLTYCSGAIQLWSDEKIHRFTFKNTTILHDENVTFTYKYYFDLTE